MKKRILSLLLALVMLLGMLPTVALAADDGWDGTTKTEPEKSGDVYQIGTAAELAWFRDEVNSGKSTLNATLTADIDLNNQEWTPIGISPNNTKSFKGTFDGAGHTISGLKIERVGTDDMVLGLFGSVGDSGYGDVETVIKNLTVEGHVTATINKTNKFNFAIAGIAGYSNGKVTLQRVVSKVDVTCTDNNNGYTSPATAGLLANAQSSDKIIECANYGDITSNNSNVAGLVTDGWGLGFKGTMTSCFNIGTVTGKAPAGGLVAKNSGTIENCYSIGEAAGAKDGTFTNCFATANTIGATGVTVKTQAELKSDEVLAALNAGGNGNAFVKGDDGLPVLSWMKSGGSDTPLAEPKWNEGGYYEIKTAQQLGWLRDQVNAGNPNSHSDFSAKLMNDITLDGDWEPIGKDYNHQYNGTFDGDNHTISALKIDQKEADASGNMELGLFGEINAATIKNLTVQGSVKATIPSSAYGSVYIAGVVASNQGKSTLENVTSNVEVTVTGNGGGPIIGGLSANAYSLTIQQCANLGNVTTENGTVAGLGSVSWGTVTVKCSYNSGNISGTTGNIGGLCANGVGNVNIDDSYNSGNISGTTGNVGGLCSGSANINFSYNTGKVTATTGKAGGLTGAAGGTSMNCYTVGEAFGDKSASCWTVYATSNDIGVNYVEVVTLDGLKGITDKLKPYSGDPKFVENKPYPPRLYWEDEANYPAVCDHPAARCEVSYAKKDSKQHTVTTFCRKCLSIITADAAHEASEDGTRCKLCGYTFCEHGDDKEKTVSFTPIEAQPGMHTKTVTCACGEIVETTAEACTKDKATGKCEHCNVDLTNVPAIEDGFYQITKEAELKWFRNEINKGNHTIKAKLMDNITLTDAWTPIGTSESHFVGSFDGNGKTISGLRFDVQNTPEESLYLGLFGYVGGNQDSAAEIRNLTVSGEICVAAGAARSVLAGGVVAYLDNHSKLSGVVSTVTVNIQADGSTAGSIIGRTNNSASNITVENCANHGDVTVNGTVGGILGQSNGSSKNMLIRDCYNDGKISGSDCTGGLIGSVQSGMDPGFGDKPTVYHTVITDSYNAGAVTGTGDYTGGLIGENQQAQILNCYNIADVRGTQKAGGLAGRHYNGSMEYCYSIGEVTGASGYMGTLIGRRDGNTNVRGLYAIAEPMIGDGDNDYIQKNQLVRKIDLVTLRQLPEELNTNQAFQIAPGKTPILIWQVVPECKHPESKKGFAYVAILKDDGTASGKHTKQLICEDCFHVFEQAAEDCTEGGNHSCIYCGAVLCNHSDTPENSKKYTYVMGSAEQGRWMHRVRFTCVTCGRALDYTEDCDMEIKYKPISGKEGERHQVLEKCKFHSGTGGYAEACVDGGDDGTTFDGKCDRCGAKLTKVLPAVQPGSGFEDYTSIEGKQEVTRYTVTHYEIGAEAEALTVVAASGNGSVPTYQWYYRMQEDAIDKDGNPIAGTPIPDATSSSFTPDTSAETEMRFYYCVVSNSIGGTATSPAQPVIVCENPTVTAYFSLTNDDKYVIGNGNGGGSGKVMAFQQVTVPYFDLGLYGLQSGYFRSETYGPQNPNDQMGGSALSAGTSATAYGKITDLHLMIYMLERHYCDLTDEQCGKGYLYTHHLMGKDSTVLETEGGAGSVLVRHYWGHDMNFNYYQNYVYPLASAGWGATADQIILRDGEIFTLAMFTDWGFYTKSGAGFQHLGTDEDKCAVSIEPGVSESFDLTLYRSYGYDQDKYDTKHTPVPNAPVYYTRADSLKVGTVGTSDWTRCGTTDANGKITVNLTALNLTAGETYLFATPGQKQGNGDDAVVACPGGILVKVAASERKTVTFVDRLGETTTQKVAVGSTVKKPADPTHAGYTFLGWFTDAACKNAYSFSAPIENDLTLYAGWQEKAAPITPVTPVTPSNPAKNPFNENAGKDSLPFTDVNANSWYYSGVKFAYEKGLMNGTGNGTFSPNADTTRGMIVTMLARLEGQNTSGTPWYTAGQKWAMDNGISDGTNMTGAITREQLAAILFRYAKQKGYDVGKSVELNGFEDANTVSTYATDAMRWAVANGLIQGSNSKLNPKGTATRAQVATILMRFMELYAK